jgi:4-hydroxybenzoate polyprenyltransferase
MFKPMMAAVVSQVVTTLALAVCLGVAAVAAAFSLYGALRLVLPDYLASGLLALIFLGVSGLLMLRLHLSHQEKPQEDAPKFGLRLLKDLALAGAVTFIGAAGVRRRPQGPARR